MKGILSIAAALSCGCSYDKLLGHFNAGDAMSADGPSGDALTDAAPAAWEQRTYIKASNTNAHDHFGHRVALSTFGTTLVVSAPAEDSAATGIGGTQVDNSGTGAGAVYMFTFNGELWSQHAYFKASNTGSGDGFGRSVALSADGLTLAVGAPSEDSKAIGVNGGQVDDSLSESGAVYVFARNGAVWNQQAYIKASNTDAGDGFGTDVALSEDGSTMVVGAAGEDGAASGIDTDQTDNSAEDAGAAYIFTRSGTTWSQQAYVKASNAGMHDNFGAHVALSSDGSILAVGAWREGSSASGVDGDQSDDSMYEAGAVYVFARNGTAWSQQAYIKASNAGSGDRFALVRLSGDGSTLAVGARLEDSEASGVDGNQDNDSALDAGAVYVFTRAGQTWSQQAYIKASNANVLHFFGHSIALSSDGTTLAASALEERGAATGINGDQSDQSAFGAGAVYIFTRSGTTWNQQAYLKSSNTRPLAHFGEHVALSTDGLTLAVGSSGETSAAIGIDGNQLDNSAPNAGAVYLFR